MSKPDSMPDLVYNGTAYRLKEGSAAELLARGVIAPDPAGDACYGLSLEHEFEEAAPFVTAAEPQPEAPRFPRLRRVLGFAGSVYDRMAWDPDLERRQKVLFPRRKRRDRD
jgi:hypothetical protein